MPSLTGGSPIEPSDVVASLASCAASSPASRVGPGAVGSPAGDGAVDELIGAERVPGELGWEADFVDHGDVGLLEQPAGRVEIGGLGPVEDDAPLIAVECVPGGRVVADGGGPAARAVAGGGFDLDDVGSGVAERHGGVGAGDALGDFDDAIAVQRSWHVGAQSPAAWSEGIRAGSESRMSPVCSPGSGVPIQRAGVPSRVQGGPPVWTLPQPDVSTSRM